MSEQPIVGQGVPRSPFKEKVEEDCVEDSGLADYSKTPVDDVPSLIVDSQVLDSSSSQRQSTEEILPVLNRAPSQTVKVHLQS